MAKFSFTVNTREIEKRIKKINDALKKNIKPRDAKRIGEGVIGEMKSFIAKGQSPIKEVGKYKPYKNPEKYPGNRKPHRPVNLELTGQQLNALKWRLDRRKVRVGYLNSELARKKESGHAEGVNSQPKRPTIPARGQNFRKTILDKIIKLVRTAVLNNVDKK